MCRIMAVFLILALMGAGCATYKPTVAPFKLPEAHANVQRVAGAYIAARTWDREDEAQEAFGFNILRAGLLPVQVNFDHRGTSTLVIQPSQTFLVNERHELFPLLTDQEAYDRLERSTWLPEKVRGLTSGALLGGAAGALLGAAIGVAAGRSVGEYAMRGAATGGAAGAILGTGIMGDTQVPRTISEDLARRQLKNTPIKPQELASGILFFPREAGKPHSLRLQVMEQETGKLHTLTFAL